KTAFGDHRHRRRDAPDRVASKGRGDRDNAPAGLLRQHLLDGELGDVQEAFEIRRDERLEVLGRVVRERLGGADVGVIDAYVDGLFMTVYLENVGSLEKLRGSEIRVQQCAATGLA